MFAPTDDGSRRFGKRGVDFQWNIKYSLNELMDYSDDMSMTIHYSHPLLEQ
tara:strand:+ start:580 stop:732 length:153 start_codon:yes stop_codon:yes gene_type:complete